MEKGESCTRFQKYLAKTYPDATSRSYSGVLRRSFLDRIVIYLKGTLDPDKKFRWYVKKNEFKLMDVPEQSLRDVLVVPVEEDQKKENDRALLRVACVEMFEDILQQVLTAKTAFMQEARKPMLVCVQCTSLFPEGLWKSTSNCVKLATSDWLRGPSHHLLSQLFHQTHLPIQILKILATYTGIRVIATVAVNLAFMNSPVNLAFMNSPTMNPVAMSMRVRVMNMSKAVMLTFVVVVSNPHITLTAARWESVQPLSKRMVLLPVYPKIRILIMMLVSCLSLSLVVCCLLPFIMAQKQQQGNASQRFYYDDIVEKLKLELTDEDRISLIENMTAEMQLTPAVMMVPTLATLVCKKCTGLDHSQMCLDIGKIATSSEQQSLSSSERALVNQYRTEQSVPPSSVTWKVLVHVGLVPLSIDDFIDHALLNEQTSQRLQLEVDGLHFALNLLKTCNTINEPLLSAACTMVFGFCTDLLQVKCAGNFEFMVQAALPDKKFYPDFTIVHKVKKLQATQKRTVLLVAELKKSMTVFLDSTDRVFSNGLAQLIYSGIKVAESQHDFMPLLVLTNGGVWHFFEIEKTGIPTRYSKAPHTGAALMRMTASTEFDATAVLSEIIAFVQRNKDHLK